MKIEVGEEISEEEYKKLPSIEGIEIIDHYKGEMHHYKKAQKFPICFEDDTWRIEVSKLGIDIIVKHDKRCFAFAYKYNFPLLVKAVEKAKEVAK